MHHSIISSTDPAHPDYRLSNYRYDLPVESIAQHPRPARDDSRLLVLDKLTGEVRHRSFKDLPSLLRSSDVLVLNETRVVPAQLIGHKPSGGRVEMLVLDPVADLHEIDPRSETIRTCLSRSSKPLKKGAAILIDERVKLTIDDVISPGRMLVRFPVPEHDFRDFLERVGRAPLPPYIKRHERDPQGDRERYQTVYSKVAGSVAAPTAGLHFTESLLEQISAKGVEIVRILLHVGPGTFSPVREEDVRFHKMEAELFEIPEHAAVALNSARARGQRILAVGTTTVRALESAANGTGVRSGRGNTDLFIAPGYSFKMVDAMVTNFHLPCSTLLMLACAFAGRERILSAYEEAVAAGYRFYSYGDACFLG